MLGWFCLEHFFPPFFQLEYDECWKIWVILSDLFVIKEIVDLFVGKTIRFKG